MQRFAELTGRRYGLFEYVGHPDAERVIVIMGSGADTVHETVEHLTGCGEKVGVLKVRLYRPFVGSRVPRRAAPDSPKPRRARSDQGAGRHRRPALSGRHGCARRSARGGGSPFTVPPRVIAGRYGLSSKEFTPAMVKAVFDEMAKARSEAPLHHRHR